jgi:hypothetical protein
MMDNNDIQSKNIWLKRGDEIVGLHAIGYREPYTFKVIDLDGSTTEHNSDFMELEKWGNEYNQDFKMIGRGSFRIFDLTIDHTAKAFEEDGWIRFYGPENKYEEK